MNTKQDNLMMDIANRVALESKDSKTKVGAVICIEDRILGLGYNGTPSGFDNECKDDHGKTLPTVIHAEINALAKVTRSTSSSVGSTVYTTMSPCVNCALNIIQSGVKEVVFRDTHKHFKEGIPLLEKAGITVRQHRTYNGTG